MAPVRALSNAQYSITQLGVDSVDLVRTRVLRKSETILAMLSLASEVEGANSATIFE